MKILVTRKHRHGKKAHIPYIGETTIPEDGVLEVESKIGNKLLAECKKSFTAIEPSEVRNKKKSEKKEEIEDEWTHLTPGELVAIAKESKLKGWQPFSKKPELLRKFLRKKAAAAGK